MHKIVFILSLPLQDCIWNPRTALAFEMAQATSIAVP